MTTTDRYPPLAVIEQYLDSEVSGAFGVAGTPAVSIAVDAKARRLVVRFASPGRVPNVEAFAKVDAHLDASEDELVVAVLIEDETTHEVYALLCALVDRVQLDGQDPADAVEEALESIGTLLALRTSLTREKQVGLFGELLVLLGAAKQWTPGDAVVSWRGPLAEEHDFGFDAYDVEVKTTTAERREHWISSISQLVPTLNRDLQLLSIQLTSAALNQGATLPLLVELCRSVFGTLADNRFNHVLRNLGYRDIDADLYRSRWTLRTEPAFFEVDADFPSISREKLRAVVGDSERITDVRYRLNLEQRSKSVTPFKVAMSLADSEAWK